MSLDLADDGTVIMAENGTLHISTDDGNGNLINIFALVFAVVALLGTFAQVLQQYIASAAGYSNCGEPVMGEWHHGKKRTFRWKELRFEVQYQTPVIFVCPPSNDKGPIKNKPIFFIDGSEPSLKSTRSLLPQQEVAKQQEMVQRGGVHTADNERATWVTLLSQLQAMERESQDWQQKHYNSNPPQRSAPVKFPSHTLAIAMQSKQRSWDTMPTDVKKPYATTAICHLLEIAAMMGIYWQEFDRSRDKYRAEGNGYMLTGSTVNDLGLVFTFQISGKCRFQENRVIPVDEVKDLCCGFVPTLFQESNKEKRRIEFPNEDVKDLGVLQFGSMNEIAETMVLIDCNTNTANYFRANNATAKHSHLFPVPFELLGMLGKTLHIRNSAYRMLPNPTPYHWDKNFFNLRRLIKEYRRKIYDSETEIMSTPQVRQLQDDGWILVRALDADKKTPTPGYSLPLLNTLHDVLDRCDAYLRDVDRDLVRMVIREHFQKVLQMLNNPEKAPNGDKKDGTKISDANDDRSRAVRFEELTAASPEERQEAFMELYFFTVLPEVRKRAVVWYRRQQSTGYYAPSIRSRTASLDSLPEIKTSSEPATPLTSHMRPLSPGPPPNMEKHRSTQSSQSVPLLRVSTPTPPPGGFIDKTTSLDSDAVDIWSTLVLRMLCWLLLHDFHKKDIQIPKSELLGNRLPVYIA